MSFQIHALPESLFSHLFELPDTELPRHAARRMIADVEPGYPCRVSLEDAAIGERVILVNYEHQPNDTPYRACHAIFVREHATQAQPEPGEVPVSLSLRLMSVRGFDRTHHLVAADVVAGEDLKRVIGKLFDNPAVDYLHLHNAKPGCFAARVTRTSSA